MASSVTCRTESEQMVNRNPRKFVDHFEKKLNKVNPFSMPLQGEHFRVVPNNLHMIVLVNV